MKKILALCLTVMLVVAMVPVFAVSADATPTITVSDAEGFISDEVTVKVSLDNNPGIISAKVDIKYDANVLQLTKATPGSAYAQMAFSQTIDVNPYTCNWIDSIHPNVTDADFVTLTFKIKDGATVGNTDITAICSFEDDFFNSDWDTVEFAIDNAVVAVKCAHKNTSEIPAVEATCTATGLTAGTKCDDCGETIKAQEVAPVKPHTEEVVDAKEATCTEPGSTGTTKCSVCNEVIKAAEVIDAKGHTEVLVDAKDATCEDAGYTGDKKCSVCNEILEKGEVIDAKGHDIAEVAAKEATCDEDGNIAHFACSVCGETYADIDGAEAITDVIVKATGHKYADGKCSVCGEDEPKEEDKPADKPADTDKPADKPNTDNGDKAPATNDVANIFVVASMLMAIAAAAVVVLKKKA